MDHPARRVLADNDLFRARRRADPAPRPVRRRPHPRLRQRPAGQRAGAARARRGAGRNPRPARRPRARRRRDPSRAARRLWRHRGRGRRSRAAMGRAARRARTRSRATAPRSSAPQREAEWLRHAVEELAGLRREPGEETALADRRTAMMQAEKVAEDLRADPRRRSAGRTRRCRRWRPRCGVWSAAPRRRRR